MYVERIMERHPRYIRDQRLYRGNIRKCGAMNNGVMSLAKRFRISVLSDGTFKASPELSNEDYLLKLLRAEQKARAEKATAERLKQARLPTLKAFEEFNTEFQKGVTSKQLEMLAKLEWLDALFNLILIGPPGAGKTHIALAIGNKAARCGYIESNFFNRFYGGTFLFSNIGTFLLDSYTERFYKDYHIHLLA